MLPQDSLPFVTMCAMLEEKGYKREEIKRLTRSYIKHVICHKRNDKGELQVQRKREPGRVPDADVRLMLMRRKLPPHLWEAKVQEWMRSMKAQSQAARERGRRNTIRKRV